MTSNQIATAIKVLIAARDNEGADVQSVIDSLFAQFEKINAKVLAAPTAEHIAHAAAVASMA